MKNNKGQALVEFALVMPILILAITSMFDLGNIIIKKYALENNLDTLVEYYKNGDEGKMNVYASNEKISYNKVSKNNNLVSITAIKDVNMTTPIVKKILGKVVKVEVNRTVYEK